MPAVLTNIDHDTTRLAVFRTNLGWFGLVGDDTGLRRITFGHASRADVMADAVSHFGEQISTDRWLAECQTDFERFAAGEPVDFKAIKLVLGQVTPFQSRVLSVVRAIPYGQTASYGEIAARVQAPGAARAVGTVMSRNRFPIVIPCHRVLGAAGALGGFSAPQGVDMKRRLLTLEQSNALLHMEGAASD